MGKKIALTPQSPVITEGEVIEFLDDCEKLEQLGKQFNELKNKTEKTEAKWLVYLELGCTLPKRYIVKRMDVPKRPQPKWKEIALSFAVKLNLSPKVVEIEEQEKARKNVEMKPTIVIEKK